MKNTIQLFEKQRVRTVWDEQAEKWWFSVLDIIAILTDQSDYKKTRNYWKWLKNKLKEEGSEVVSVTNQLKLSAPDGKMRLTDVVDTEQIFRIIQSIPSKKAEPFKSWLAEVAKKRLDQIQDPELSIEQAMWDYKNLGYSENWINQRLKVSKFAKNSPMNGKNTDLKKVRNLQLSLTLSTKHGQKKQQKNTKSLKV